jgi:hypothetical protein
MSVRQVGVGHWYSTLAEQTYDSELAARHYDNLERMRSMVDSEGDKLLASLTPEQIRSLDAAARLQADQVNRRQDWQDVQKEFVAANPDYLANTANGSALAAVLVERGKLNPDGTFLGTLEDVQEVYVDLAEKNVLQLRPGTRLPKRTDGAAEAYGLPLEEVKRRALGW